VIISPKQAIATLLTDRVNYNNYADTIQTDKS